MFYFADIKDPAKIIEEFLLNFNNQASVLISILRSKPGQYPDDRDVRLNIWRHELQNQQFLLAGMVCALGQHLNPPKGFHDSPNSFRSFGSWLTSENPESDKGLVAFAEAAQWIRRLCRENLEAITKTNIAPRSPPD